MQVLKQIENCGVVGAGGAGFPSHVKFNASAEYVIMNAAECEPLLHKDKELLLKYGSEIIDGMNSVMEQVGAKRGIIGIKGKYLKVIDHVRSLLKKDMEIIPLDNFYPAGDELTLVHETTGIAVAPGNIPLTAGCVVTNVETLLNVSRSKPVTTTFLTVAGEVANPISLEVAIGVSHREVIEAAGGAICPDPVMILGGPMMGSFSEDFDTPVDKRTGGVIVLDRSHPLAKNFMRSQKQYQKIAKVSCDQCCFCTELCPRYLLGHPVYPHIAMRNMAFDDGRQLIASAEFCCECNLCTAVSCPEGLDPKNVITDMRHRVMAQREERLKFEPGSVEAHPMKKYRKTPLPKLMQKLGIDGFVNQGPLLDSILSSSLVRVALQQHIGAPAISVVKSGDRVERGQLIGCCPEGKLGANVHASIDGVVTVTDGFIEIRG